MLAVDHPFDWPNFLRLNRELALGSRSSGPTLRSNRELAVCDVDLAFVRILGAVNWLVDRQSDLGSVLA